MTPPPGQAKSFDDEAEKILSSLGLPKVEHVEIIPSPERRARGMSRATPSSPLKNEVTPSQVPPLGGGMDPVQTILQQICKNINDKPDVFSHGTDHKNISMLPPQVKIDDRASPFPKGPAPWRPKKEPARTPSPAKLTGPKICFGDSAEQPRWLIEPIPREVERQHPVEGFPDSQLTSASSVTLGRPMRPFADRLAHHHPESNMLQWRFDAGDPSGWNGFKSDQLYEYAYKYLENSLGLPIIRAHIRAAIMSGPHSAIVPKDEDPLPDLPPAPTTDYFESSSQLQRIAADALQYEGFGRPSPLVSPGTPHRSSKFSDLTTKFIKSIKGYPEASLSHDGSGDSPRYSPQDSSGEGSSEDSKLETTSSGQSDEDDLESGQRSSQKTSGDDGQPAPIGSNDGNLTRAAGGRTSPDPLAHGLPTITSRSQVMGSAQRTETSSDNTGSSRRNSPVDNWPQAQRDAAKAVKKLKETLLNDPSAFEKHFPRRTFRRMRRWSGESFYTAKEDILEGELEALSDSPSSFRPFSGPVQRPSANSTVRGTGRPRTTKAKTTKKTRSNRVTRAPRPTQQGSSSTPAVAPKREPRVTTCNTPPLRRNPKRGCRDP
ncbi:hypothetical protein AWENTII_001090 [Aspergillus wentii]